ncbi:MAG: MBL fold metallo-hydrolase [Candidatus Omnitrophica bacterium]|jgi:L-ascorbate metabolism protein UlaG (beta-lactamase superfamily)|nr:MBL fold metallo-hydrolase [Candidatus Omnitrophota bacterium]
MDITNIKWLGHASFRIEGPKVIYIDPFKINPAISADIILITHSHFDHFSPEDINKIKTADTFLIAPKDCQINWKTEKRIVLIPDEKIDIEGIKIHAVSAYNTNKKFHPKTNNWVGYIIDINEFKIYHAGDTDEIKEMENIDVDIALLPVGGTYTMDAKESASALKKIKTKAVIPMHYGSIVGTEDAAIVLKNSTNINIIIPEKSI